MGVKVYIHKTQQQFTEGQSVVDVHGDTVEDCLKTLVRRFPQMKGALFDNKGNLSNTIEIYVNLQNVYPDELTTGVKDGDKIHITILIAGG